MSNEDAAAPPPPEDRNRAPKGVTRVYENDAIRVLWYAERCVHAAACILAQPQVFDPRRRPWIQLGNTPADDIADAVERCPTGALKYERKDGGPAEAVPEKTTAKTLRNGPHLLRGDIEIYDADGTLLRKDTRVALCRCGRSAHMPFCDNSHRATGFTDAK